MTKRGRPFKSQPTQTAAAKQPRLDIDEAVDDVLPLAIAQKFREILVVHQMAEAYTSHEDAEKRKPTAAVAALATMAHSSSYGMGQGLVADSMEHLDQEMMMDDPIRRHLGSAGYISYGALARNKVPCDKRGQSYYNCKEHEAANPYSRGCTRVTSCARSTV
ncbi:protein RALF-like 19 [Salvia hispanica]|uniref:protein RALF-like 19 n=1 Tax=Salvia hispanica TaxID=49212 RepID=UPI00200931C7|nr:protein RALF-like 19 [Salvia hispanica]